MNYCTRGVEPGTGVSKPPLNRARHSASIIVGPVIGPTTYRSFPRYRELLQLRALVPVPAVI
jgi:hypothetical protein